MAGICVIEQGKVLMLDVATGEFSD